MLEHIFVHRENLDAAVSKDILDNSALPTWSQLREGPCDGQVSTYLNIPYLTHAI